MANELLKAKLLELGADLEVKLIQQLIRQGHVASGALIESISSRLDVGINRISLLVDMDEHGLFIERGRKAGGKKVPIDALEAWLQQRRFSWAVGNIRGSAFAVQTNIHKFGIKPKLWITETLKRNESSIEAVVEEALLADFTVTVNNLATDVQKQFVNV